MSAPGVLRSVVCRMQGRSVLIGIPLGKKKIMLARSGCLPRFCWWRWIMDPVKNYATLYLGVSFPHDFIKCLYLLMLWLSTNLLWTLFSFVLSFCFPSRTQLLSDSWQVFIHYPICIAYKIYIIMFMCISTQEACEPGSHMKKNLNVVWIFSV